MIFGFFSPGYDDPGYAPLPPVVIPMPEKIIFLSPRVSDKATVMSSTQVDSLPVGNIQNQEPAKVFRTTSTIDQWISFVLPSVTPVDAIAMAWNQEKFSSSAVWRAYIYATQADMDGNVNEVVDTGWVSVWPGSAYKHTMQDWGPEVALLSINNTQSYRYVKLWISDPTAPQAYLDISRVAVGAKAQFRINPRIDGGINFVPIDVQESNGYGQVFTDPRPWQQRQFVLTWSALGQGDVQFDAMELARLRGQAGDFFVFIDPAASDDFHLKSMQGIFEGQHKFNPANIYIPDADGRMRLGWGFTFTCTQKL